MNDSHAAYDRIARAIGQTCLWWVRLEGIVHDIILHLASCIDASFNNDPTFAVLHITVTNMDIRQRVATAKALASLVEAPAGYYKRLESALNSLDNDLRPERNRYVHDKWNFQEGTVERRKVGTVVFRPQARQLDMRLETAKQYDSLADVETFILRLLEAFQTLMKLDEETADIAERTERQSKSPPPTPLEI